MLDAALIKECADPSLKPAIVEQFVAAAGSTDPLAVTVKSGGRLVLVPKARSADEAMTIVRQYAGQAVVRVGLTQFPAGVDVKNAADLKPDLVDACENLRKGTSMFAKILRIVAKWYGNPKAEDVFPQIFEDAVHAWKTGEFEGVSVFQAQDPGDSVELPQPDEVHSTDGEEAAVATPEKQAEANEDVERAGIRIDLSRIGGN
ncbi:TraH family protein [Sinorhizobium sp. BJ1]|uniref:TraH family protein n=1 Tax=Sinorhizobium sp. BJ1 TaxID=2035455 RepID=UPI000BEA4E6F|nr:TraH family protein [Sinorhizobium sp. BJ1]PDT82165.1 conjugal transfer protein TraH [Sinorhizobium sp. BJ1]